MKNDFTPNEYTDDLREAIKDLGGIKAVSERFKIPYRTVQNWARGIRHPPEYVALLIIDHAQEKVIHESCMEDAYTLYQKALSKTEEKHPLSAEREEIETLKIQNEVLQEQFDAAMELANMRKEEVESNESAISELEQALDATRKELEKQKKACEFWAGQAARYSNW